MRDYDGQLLFNPQLPDGMTRLAFSVRWQDMRLKVEIRADEVIYSSPTARTLRVRLS